MGQATFSKFEMGSETLYNLVGNILEFGDACCRAGLVELLKGFHLAPYVNSEFS